MGLLAQPWCKLRCDMETAAADAGEFRGSTCACVCVWWESCSSWLLMYLAHGLCIRHRTWGLVGCQAFEVEMYVRITSARLIDECPHPNLKAVWKPPFPHSLSVITNQLFLIKNLALMLPVGLLLHQDPPSLSLSLLSIITLSPRPRAPA